MVSVPVGLLIRWSPRSLPGVRPRPRRRVTEYGVDIEGISHGAEQRGSGEILVVRVRTGRLPSGSGGQGARAPLFISAALTPQAVWRRIESDDRTPLLVPSCISGGLPGSVAACATGPTTVAPRPPAASSILAAQPGCVAAKALAVS